VTIGLFEVTKTTGKVLAKSLRKLLDKYGFLKIYIAYKSKMKDLISMQ
jgi:hypothetical protein